MRYNNNELRGTTIDLRPRKRHPKDKRPPTAMPFDVGLRKFRKAVEKAGILKEIRKREFYKSLLLKEIEKRLKVLKDTKRKLRLKD